MKNKFINIPLLLTVLIVISAGCSKTYRYDFKDGYGNTPPVNDTANLTEDTSMFHIDRSKYATARMFPGLVGDDEARLKDYVVDLDLDFKTPDKSFLRISTIPEPWFGTGLYAPAGELIQITVPDGVYGLTAQVGVWTDNLTGISPTLRDPVIVNRAQLFPGVNYIRNLYGGPLIIQASRSLGRTIQLKVTGAAKSPDFVLGKTTDAEWKQMISKTTVPWFELRGKRIVFALPVSKLSSYPINHPTELMEAWDSVVAEDYNAWYGLSDDPADPRDQAPELAWLVELDIQPKVGYGHSSYPIVAKMDDNWFRQIVSVDALRNSSDWGTLHELGHNFQMGTTWQWGDLGEVSNNLHSFKVANRYGHKHSKMSSSDFTSALAFAASKDADKKFTDMNVSERMTPFVQIFEKYGYDFQTYLCTAARHDQHTAINEQDKIDFYYERLSEYVKMDMASWMSAWGLTVSQQSKNKISQQYPPLNRDVWEYNPWTGQGGDDPIRADYSRSNWTALQQDYDVPTGRVPQNVLDGNTSTVWHMDKSHDYPHTLTIDMHQVNRVSGLSFVQRTPLNGALKDITVEISDDGNSWNAIGDFVLEDIGDKQYIDFSQIQTFRYLKVICKSDYKGNDFTALAEVGAFQ